MHENERGISCVSKVFIGGKQFDMSAHERGTLSALQCLHMHAIQELGYARIGVVWRQQSPKSK